MILLHFSFLFCLFKLINIKFRIIVGGRKLFNESQIDIYLNETKSKLTNELFVFDSLVNIKQSYRSNGKIISSDISDGQENVPISAVNEIDNDEPSAFTYHVERRPVEGVHMVVNEPTMTYCSCTDGCRNRIQCACKLFNLNSSSFMRKCSQLSSRLQVQTMCVR